jgi:hypothetical protein
METRARGSRGHYELVGRRARSVYIASWGAALVLSIAVIAVPVSGDGLVVRLLGFVMALGAGWLLFRLIGWATIDLYDDSVVIRGIFRTSRMVVADIDRFLTVEGLNDVNEAACALAVRTRNGTIRVFSDFSSRDEGTSPVAQLVDELNSRIAA